MLLDGSLDVIVVRKDDTADYHKGVLHDITEQRLLEKEILFQADLERLIGKRPFDKPTTYQQYTNGQGKYEKKKHEAEQPGVDPTPTLEGDVPNQVASS